MNNYQLKNNICVLTEFWLDTTYDNVIVCYAPLIILDA